MSHTNFHATSWACVKSGLKIEVTNINPDGSMSFAVRNKYNDGCLDNRTSLAMHREPMPSSRTAEWLATHRFNDFSAALIAAEKFVSNNLQYVYGGEA